MTALAGNHGRVVRCRNSELEWRQQRLPTGREVLIDRVRQHGRHRVVAHDDRDFDSAGCANGAIVRANSSDGT